MRIRVKICGLTCPADVAAAVEAGADAIGIVLAPSRRRVDLRTARVLLGEVPPLVSRVGVFVDPTSDEVEAALAECALDWVQLHGQESPEFCRRLGPRALKAVRMRAPEDLDRLGVWDGIPLLLDSPAPGSGASFDWRWVRGLGESRRIILAGGLTPDNVAEAIRVVRPWAVDVSSGVEREGRKDPARISEFIRAVRESGERLAEAP